MCFGSTLSYIEPSPDDRGKQAEGGWASRTVGAGESQASATPMAGTSDPDDSWCENASICHSDISDYISKTKGNAAYGNQNGVIGTFDVVLRTNLNGRQPRYTVKYIRDTGPTLTIKGTVNCVKDQVFDGTCGHYSVGTRTVSSKYTSGLINADRIANDKPDNYFSTITGTLTAKGYSNISGPCEARTSTALAGPGHASSRETHGFCMYRQNTAALRPTNVHAR